MPLCGVFWCFSCLNSFILFCFMFYHEAINAVKRNPLIAEAKSEPIIFFPFITAWSIPFGYRLSLWQSDKSKRSLSLRHTKLLCSLFSPKDLLSLSPKGLAKRREAGVCKRLASSDITSDTLFGNNKILSFWILFFSYRRGKTKTFFLFYSFRKRNLIGFLPERDKK